MSRRGISILCLISLPAIALAGAGSAEPGRLVEPAEMSWLAGCWQDPDGEPGSGELWTRPAGDALFAVSRTVRQGRTVAHEFIRIQREASGQILFHAQPSGQPAASFALLPGAADELIFENPSHDFPQRIIYRRESVDRLAAAIEGEQDGKTRRIAFPLHRVSCRGAEASQ